MRYGRILFCLFALLFSGACTLVNSSPAGSTSPTAPGPRRPSQPPLTAGPPASFGDVPDATPREEPRARSGNPESYEQNGQRYRVMDSSEGYQEEGLASWYGEPFHGRRTSSGERYDMYLMTAAHKTLPLPTYVEVTNLDNDRRIVVRVNDRGPFHEGRIIDLSYVAAGKLGMLGAGTARVRVRALDPASRD